MDADLNLEVYLLKRSKRHNVCIFFGPNPSTTEIIYRDGFGLLLALFYHVCFFGLRSAFL